MCATRWMRVCSAAALIAVFSVGVGAEDKPSPGLTNKGPLSPHEERATFKVPRGFRVELVACEPDVVDPVAMAFDEDGRIFVAEMRGYPNGGRGTGHHHLRPDQAAGGPRRRRRLRDEHASTPTACASPPA